MLKFGLSQKLLSLLFISISVSILLSLNLPAAAAVNSPTLTVLDMGEMSQIAGGTYCYEIESPKPGKSGSCSPTNSICGSHISCGTNPYVIILPNQGCVTTRHQGHHYCHCSAEEPGWLIYNCQICKLFKCKPELLDRGGVRSRCNVYTACAG